MSEERVGSAELETEGRLAIHELLNLYPLIVDSKDWSRLDRVFADDAVYDMSAVRLGRHEGLEAIRQKLVAMDHPPAHFALGAVLRVLAEGDVVAWSKYFVRLQDRSVLDGLYEDVLTRTAAGWRIASRVIHPTGLTLPN